MIDSLLLCFVLFFYPHEKRMTHLLTNSKHKELQADTLHDEFQTPSVQDRRLPWKTWHLVNLGKKDANTSDKTPTI